MDNFFLIFILTSMLGLIVFCIFLYLLRKKRRAKYLAHSSEQYGFRFVGDIDANPKDKFVPLRLFCIRVPGKMKNVLKRNNPKICIFDYEYSIPRDQFVGQTVVVLEIRKTKLPPTVIETKKKERFTVAVMRLLTQKLANWQLSYKKVDFSSHPEFAKSYRVFCENNPESLKEVLTASLMNFLVQNPGWNIEAMDQWLLIYRPGEYLKPKEFEKFINLVVDIYKLIEQD